MTITQRIELRRLGYSKEEIAELAAAEAAAAAQPEPEPQPEPVKDQAPAAAAPPEPAAAGMNNGATMADVLTAINNLTTALQRQNINNTPQPAEPAPETATDIFTNILKG